MEEFLKTINLENLISTFAENDINMDNIYNLDDELYRELIPSIGQRVHFLSELRNYMLKKNIIVDVADESTSEEEIVRTVNTNNEIPCSSRGLEEYIVVPTEPRETSFIGLENLNTIITFPDFDLKTLLEVTPLGNTILNYYKKKKFLDHSRRTILVDIIMKKIYNFYIKHRMTHEYYNLITAKILTLFPNECAATYYVPAVSKRHSLTNQPIIAKGRLVDKCRNLLRISKSLNIHNDKENKNCENIPKRNFSNMMQNDKLWLKNRNTPWEEVIEKWKNTFDMRQCTIHSTIEAFIKDWPILNHQNSDSLIDIDFETLYPNSSLKIHEQWKKFIEKLLSIKEDLVKDKYAIELLEIIRNDDANDNTRTAAEILLLPYLIPPKGRTKIAQGKHWKFSIIEACESLILQSKIPGDIEEVIKNYKSKCFDLKQPMQPLILINGPGLFHINSIYVVIDEVKYQFDTVIKSLDVCFKIFHVLNASYPVQSEHIWLIIQKAVYEINSEKDKIIPYIMDIIELLKSGE